MAGMFNIRAAIGGWNKDFRRIALAGAAVGVFFGVLGLLDYDHT